MFRSLLGVNRGPLSWPREPGAPTVSHVESYRRFGIDDDQTGSGLIILIEATQIDTNQTRPHFRRQQLMGRFRLLSVVVLRTGTHGGWDEGAVQEGRV